MLSKYEFLWEKQSKQIIVNLCSLDICCLCLGWRKPKSDHEEDSPSEVTTLENQTSKSDSTFHRHGLKGKMSFKTASQATLTFLSARRRIEGGLKSLAKKAQKAEHSKGTCVCWLWVMSVVFAWLLTQLAILQLRPKHTHT